MFEWCQWGILMDGVVQRIPKRYTTNKKGFFKAICFVKCWDLVLGKKVLIYTVISSIRNFYLPPYVFGWFDMILCLQLCIFYYYIYFFMFSYMWVLEFVKCFITLSFFLRNILVYIYLYVRGVYICKYTIHGWQI